ncbi:MAG: glycosyltransferase family 2 protein, partial [Rhodopirellula sp. JB055]|uniref:glycosyltransferase family 2 protein n=1 Tax=Rhodopirellula sp. JB055 TaxID=3342846 RepID=UPI00370B7BAC
MTAAPEISVVIPLPDDRGHLLDCLKGFTQQEMDVPYEVIVAATDGDARGLKELLNQFPSVRCVQQPGLNVNALYNLAASAARGTYLYLTESHCIPQRNCLSQIYELAHREQVPAACSASNGVNQNRVAEGEQRIFEEDFLSWIGDKKCKISVRGTLILRSIWEEIGGFLPEYGHFSEVMIGAKLESMGVRFAYAEKSIVSHVNQVCTDQLRSDLMEHGVD